MADIESAATHDARCEREYTTNGLIFIDCLCSLRRAKAEAWDEGANAAIPNYTATANGRANPYRITRR